MKYIYFLTTGTGYYKIGITDNLNSRLSGINSSNPVKLKFVATRLVKNALDLEQLILEEYKEFRSNGEWLQLSPEQALAICQRIHLEESIDEIRKLKIEITEVVTDLIETKFHGLLVEVKKIADKSQSNNLTIALPQLSPIPSKIDLPKVDAKIAISDEGLTETAIKIIAAEGRGSASLLQRKLKIGYARSARILDRLEEMGFIGKGMGASPREFLGIPKNYVPLALR